MFILGDETKHRGVPWVTFGLVGVNLVVFVLQLGIGDSFTRGCSLVPAEITSGKDLVKPAKLKVKQTVREYVPGPGGFRSSRFVTKEVEVDVPQAQGPRPIYLTLVTSMFMHGGWVHLIGNMWFLLIFGRNVELAMRHGLFLCFYLTCGIVSGLADVLVMPSSVVPYLGASGAISGVMGAYFFIFPLNRIKVWIAIYLVELPTYVVVGLWFLIQYSSTALTITYGQIHTGIAYWSHLAGFLTGVAFILVTLAILKSQQGNEPPADEEEPGAESEPATLSDADRLFQQAGACLPQPLAPTPPMDAEQIRAHTEAMRQINEVDHFANSPSEEPAEKKSLTSR